MHLPCFISVQIKLKELGLKINCEGKTNPKSMVCLKIRIKCSVKKRTGQLISVFLSFCHLHLLRALQ